VVTWLQRARIFLGIDTEADRRARHKHMLQCVQDALNAADRKDADRTPTERPRR
jgi:hypothetical protein